jgi:outer membrane lipoprotein-sorting protein
MKFRSLSLLLTFSIVFGNSCKAQTADEIINKHVDAIGGKEKLAKVKTTYAEGEVMIPNNPLGTGKSKTYKVMGKSFREEISFGDKKVVETYSAKGSWLVNPFMNKIKPEPMDEETTKAGMAQLNVGSPLIDYVAAESSVELVGKENINGADAHKLKVVTKDGTEFTYLIDPATFYILKRSIRSKSGQNIKSEIFSDYRKIDEGIVIPFASEFTIGPSTTMYMIVDKVEINKDIDPSVFEMPKQ